MSADNSSPDVLVPLRNLVNCVKSTRDRVRDGESNECSGTFSLSNFWETLDQAVKTTSQEATKLSLMFSRPPVPSEQECAKLADSFRKSVLALSTVYFWLPKSQGITLRRGVRDATAEVFEGLVQLLDVILSSPLQSLSQDQLTSTGGVWAACDQFNQLPKDNRSAVLAVLTSNVGLVKDALEEMEQALAESQDPFGDILDDDDMDVRGNQDTYWSQSDRQLIRQCQGLMKASGACLRKLSSAVRNNGRVETEENVAQLDDLADVAKDVSPSIDDLTLSLYPPVDRSAVDENVCKLVFVLKKVLEITRTSHVCLEPDVSWVAFLDGAVNHNLEKVQSLLRDSNS
ncbi:cyclin-D1-binding protein 1 homolog isoform X1 [Triplophysa rosa]|uniref:Cyclin-D1-binding protein 1-like protein n=1 Tax=Triplophysa rosa TaxID=992332 RepID=A0A9W7WTW9_TRIRA|nr:cyclin-D1-binding protein 1 homolog isoform X1 [Triplophysa rosa]KAI7808175.1 cyclin-D1-binding protein 1-like protein [Triplophysa rosa]